MSTTGPSTANKKATILLVSGELDKAIAAFDIGAGMAAMGMEVRMWFLLFGTNPLRKPVARLSPRRWLNFAPLPDGPGRTPETDTVLQRALIALNGTGPRQLPLSQLNFLGLGPALLRRILDRKRVAQLDTLIESCAALDVPFLICQTCVDSMALSPQDFSVPVEMRGVSTYTLQVAESHYNAVF